MAISQQYLKPQNQAPQWMPQGNQGYANQMGGNQQMQRYGNQLGAYQAPSFSPYQEQNWFSKFFLGTPEHFQQTPRFTPQGQDLLSQLQSMGLQNQQNPYEGFDPLAQETMNQFYQQVLPGISRQFIGATNGAPSSPSFHSQLASGGQGLSAMLNAQKARYGQENKEFGLRQSQLGLTDPFETFHRPNQPGFLENLANKGLDAAGTAAKMIPYLL